MVVKEVSIQLELGFQSGKTQNAGQCRITTFLTFGPPLQHPLQMFALGLNETDVPDTVRRKSLRQSRVAAEFQKSASKVPER